MPARKKKDKGAATKRGGSRDSGKKASADDAQGGAEEAAVPVSLHGDLDPVIHTRIRLGILSALSAAGAMSFNELKETLQTTDGNLSVHARKLEDAGYVSAAKSFVDRMPLTTYKLTVAGKKALADYLDQMEAIIRLARSPTARNRGR